MSDSHRPDAAGPTPQPAQEIHNTKLFRAVTYSGGTLLALWGIIEMFLRIDPFISVYFKFILWPSIGILAFSLASILFLAMPWPRPVRGRSVLVLWVLFALGLLYGLYWVWTPAFGSPAPQARASKEVLGTVLLYAAAVSLSLVCIMRSRVEDRRLEADPRRGWHWLDWPVLAPGVLIGLVGIMIATGRAQEISKSDVAQEELRQAGLEFSMESLQNAIYFNSDRSIFLFREAGVDSSDILNAFGRKSQFSEGKPLIVSNMERVNAIPFDCDRDSGGYDEKYCSRVGKFVSLFLEERQRTKSELEILLADLLSVFDPSAVATSGLDEGSRSRVCEDLYRAISLAPDDGSAIDGTPPRPVFGHALSGGHAAIVEQLLSLCPQGLDPVGPFRGEAAGGRREDGSDEEVQRHARAVVDPHLAVIYGQKHDPARWTAVEADRVHRALCRDGIPFTGILGQAAPDSIDATCKLDGTGGAGEEGGFESPPMEGRLVTIGPEGCEIAPFAFRQERAIALRRPQRQSSEAGSVRVLDGRSVDPAGNFKLAAVQRWDVPDGPGRTRLLVAESPAEDAILQFWPWAEDMERRGGPVWVAGRLQGPPPIRAALLSATDGPLALAKEGARSLGPLRTIESIADVVGRVQGEKTRQTSQAREGEARSLPAASLAFGDSPAPSLLFTLPQEAEVGVIADWPSHACISFARRGEEGQAVSVLATPGSQAVVSPRLAGGDYTMQVVLTAVEAASLPVQLVSIDRIQCLEAGRSQQLESAPRLRRSQEVSLTSENAREFVCRFQVDTRSKLNIEAISQDDIQLFLKENDSDEFIETSDRDMAELDGQAQERIDAIAKAGSYVLEVSAYNNLENQISLKFQRDEILILDAVDLGNRKEYNREGKIDVNESGFFQINNDSNLVTEIVLESNSDELYLRMFSEAEMGNGFDPEEQKQALKVELPPGEHLLEVAGAAEPSEYRLQIRRPAPPRLDCEVAPQLQVTAQAEAGPWENPYRQVACTFAVEAPGTLHVEVTSDEDLTLSLRQLGNPTEIGSMDNEIEGTEVLELPVQAGDFVLTVAAFDGLIESEGITARLSLR